MGQVSYDFNENLKQKMKMLVCSDRRVSSSPWASGEFSSRHQE